MFDLFILTLEALDNESDRDFLLRLYNEYHRLVYSVSVEIVQNSDEAEDLTQDVFVKLIPKAAELRTKDERRLVSYIASAAKNTTYEYLSHKRVVSKHAIDDPNGFILDNAEADYVLEDRVIRREQLQALMRVWPQLSDRDRYLLRARYILHKSDAEIGAGLGVKQDSVRTLVLRARKSALALMREQGVELV